VLLLGIKKLFCSRAITGTVPKEGEGGGGALATGTWVLGPYYTVKNYPASGEPANHPFMALFWLDFVFFQAQLSLNQS
jgi:hypothetical protein